MRKNIFLENRATRLNDRGILKDNPGYHKNVFKVNSAGNKEHILVRILNKKYKSVWKKNIKGIEVCEKMGVNCPKLLRTKERSLELLMSNVGKSITNCSIKRLPYFIQLGLIELRKLNNHKKNRLSFFLPRYLETLLNVRQNFPIEKEFDFVFRILDVLSKSKFKSDYGSGTDDPSPTNFCHRYSKVFLIDFDNFNNKTNFEYELGFLIADLIMRFNLKFNNWKELNKYFYQFARDEYKRIGTKEQQIQLFVGLLSLFSTLLIDCCRKERDSEKIVNYWKKEIFVICNILYLKLVDHNKNTFYIKHSE